MSWIGRACVALVACSACLPGAGALSVGLPDADAQLALPGVAEVGVRTNAATPVDVDIGLPDAAPAGSSASAAQAEDDDVTPGSPPPQAALAADDGTDPRRTIAFAATGATALGALVALVAARRGGSVVPW